MSYYPLISLMPKTAPVDPDAQAFITAASITDPTQQSAIITLVGSLKTNNIWSKLKGVYPIVGGVASSHAVNLKTPGTFNLTFATGWTHSSTGMTTNGGTYANTSLTPSTALTLNNTHLLYYAGTYSQGIDMGCTIAGDNPSFFIAGTYFGNFYADSYSGGSRFQLAGQTTGMLAITRTATNSYKAFKNTTQIGTTITSTSGSLPTWNIWLGGSNRNGSLDGATAKQYRFFSIGDGLTDTDITNYYNAIQAFQTTLGRQI